METPVAKKIRIFRREEAILAILADFKKSKLNIKTFCAANNIASATFHTWKKRYSKRLVKSAKSTGFTALQVTSPATSGAPLFAEVKEIKIYQWVTAAYLKELLT